MFYIYIIFSPSSDKFYVGYSNDPQRSLIEHNIKPFNSYTSKRSPWVLKACFQCSEVEQEAITIERFIKKQKSRKLLERLCNFSFIPSGVAASVD